MGKGRRIYSVLLVGTLLLGNGLSTSAESTAAGFTDIEASYPYTKLEIDQLVKSGIITGYEDGTFRQNNTATRAETARVIVLTAGLKTNPGGADVFRDIDSKAWYKGDVGALVQAGIANGTATDRFTPDVTITREELIVFYIRALGLEKTAKEQQWETGFSDFSDVADWAKPAVALAVRIGLVQGIEQPGGRLALNPKAAVVRQELAHMAYEFYTNRVTYQERGDQLSLIETPSKEASIQAVSVLNPTTVQVSFDSTLKAANADDFRFEPQLQVQAASLQAGNEKVVKLTTEPQIGGTVYKLIFKGKDTGQTLTGARAASVSTGGDTGSEEQINVADLLSKGEPLTNVTIMSSGIFGPSNDSGLRTVITGTLTLDPGPEGEVTLRNIEPERLVVLSGKDGTIKLQQTVIKQLRVNAINNGGKDVRIEAQDGTDVTEIEVESQGVLESSSSTGKLGTIKLASGAAGKSLTLKGNIEGDVEVNAPGSTLKLAPPSTGNSQPTVIKNLKVGQNSTIQSGTGTTLSKVSLTGNNTNLSIQGTGTIETVDVDESADGAALNLESGTNIGTIQASSTVTLSGDPEAITKTKIEGSGGVKLSDSIKSSVKAKALDNAIAAIDAIGDFTVYSEEIQGFIDKAAEFVKQAKTFGAEDTDISNLSKLTSMQTTVAELKGEVKQDEAFLTIPSKVTGTISLPTTGTKGTAIVWMSSDSSIISSSGGVQRPKFGSPDAIVTLTATVSKLGYSSARMFNVTVQAQESVTPTVTKVVYEPKVTVTSSTYQLEILAKLSDYSVVNVTSQATGWTSSNPTVANVSASGLLTKGTAGTTTVTAMYSGFTASFEVTVFDGTLTYSASGQIWTSDTGTVVPGHSYVPISWDTDKKFTIPSSDSREYFIVELNGFLDDNSHLNAVVTGMDGAQVVDIYSNHYVIIHHGKFTSGTTYTFTISGLKYTHPSDGQKVVNPITITIVKNYINLAL
ncbi:hypothetical protein ASG89_27875 [Paenibacillus sp. Soil766]|uniref:S-layer homology domain-containing protein n=1 Tax=Paenibacillus sp. Soil766 TaxID=1736404 RepID=UPI00070D599E|nr:S-layer homology domain-containing protein [Paenibacillus sp. Soil766]KRE99383.1 hypothetical protein ASG89_27875 [Paenibacillus sp. Soil766]